jgi:hypothetical protein
VIIKRNTQITKELQNKRSDVPKETRLAVISDLLKEIRERQGMSATAIEKGNWGNECELFLLRQIEKISQKETEAKIDGLSTDTRMYDCPCGKSNLYVMRKI